MKNPSQMIETPEEEAQDQGGVAEGSAGDVEPSAGLKPAGGPAMKPNVTPEEQKKYDSVMTLFANRLYDPGYFQAVVRRLGMSQQDPAKEVGGIASKLVQQIKNYASKKHKVIEPDIMFAATEEVVSDLVTIAISSGLIPEQKRIPAYEVALFEALRLWGKDMQSGGEITGDVQQRAQDELKQLGVPWQPPEGSDPAARVADASKPSALAAQARAAQPPQQAQQPPQQMQQPQMGGIVNNAMGA